MSLADLTFRNSRTLAIALLSTILTIAEPLSAKPVRCENILLGLPGWESSVEIEISANPRLFQILFTSLDGTIRPITAHVGLEGIPPEVMARLQRDHPETSDILGLDFETLKPEEAISIIMQTARVSKHSYDKSRTVPGLKYREKITLVFPLGGARIFGRFYGSGLNRMTSAEFFGDTAIEFMAENRMRENLGFELHVRTDHRPSENFYASRDFQRALQGDIGHLHEHVVGELNQHLLKTALSQYSLQVAEYTSRLAFFTTLLRAIKHKRFQRIDNANGYTNNFRNGTSRSFEDVEQFIQKEVVRQMKAAQDAGQDFETWTIEAQNEFRMLDRGFIAVAMGTRYDGGGFKIGIEFRDLAPSLPDQILAQLMDSTQLRFGNSDFGVDAKLLEQMHAKPNGLQMYFPPLIEAHGAATALVEHLIPENERAQFANLPYRMAMDRNDNDLIGILLKRFDRDPLFRGQPKVLEHVERIQAKALRLLKAGADPDETLYWFIKKSGIFHHVGRSLIYNYDPSLIGALLGKVNLKRRDQ